MRFKSLFWAGCIAGALAGIDCNCHSTPPAQPVPDAGPVEAAVLSEHRFESPFDAGAGTLATGADCKQYGAPSCASAICLHTSPDPEAGWLCSLKCDCAEQCPAQWTCVQIHPLESARYCLPAAP